MREMFEEWLFKYGIPVGDSYEMIEIENISIISSVACIV